MSSDKAKPNDRLTNEQLDDVAGGFNPQPDPPGRTSQATTDPPAPDKISTVIGGIKIG